MIWVLVHSFLGNSAYDLCQKPGCPPEITNMILSQTDRKRGGGNFDPKDMYGNQQYSSGYNKRDEYRHGDEQGSPNLLQSQQGNGMTPSSQGNNRLRKEPISTNQSNTATQKGGGPQMSLTTMGAQKVN